MLWRCGCCGAEFAWRFGRSLDHAAAVTYIYLIFVRRIVNKFRTPRTSSFHAPILELQQRAPPTHSLSTRNATMKSITYVKMLAA